MAVEPLLVTRLREGGFASRDKLLNGIFLRARACEGSLWKLFGDKGASSITKNRLAFAYSDYVTYAVECCCCCAGNDSQGETLWWGSGQIKFSSFGEVNMMW
jgi:hypothetical protein